MALCRVVLSPKVWHSVETIGVNVTSHLYEFTRFPLSRGESFVQSGTKLVLPDDMTVGAIVGRSCWGQWPLI